MTKRKIKFGRVYKKWNVRNGVRTEHKTWTVRYKGRDYATGTEDPREAEKFLLRLAGRLAEHNLNPQLEPSTDVLMAELFDDLEYNAERKKNDTAVENRGRIKLHLRPFFNTTPAASLTSAHFEEYTDRRLEEEAAPATINKELALLKRALKLAFHRDPPKIKRVPKIEMLKVNNARKGFLLHPQYKALKAALPPYLQPVLVAGYHIGNRRGELLQIEIRDVELTAIPQPQFRLYADATKTDEGRVVPIYGEMIEVFRAQIAHTKKSHPACPWLFHNAGQPIQTFYKAWRAACKAAEVEGLLFHDLRRTAVRNLIRAGVSRKVAMEITGHKTEEIFSRYDITDESDLADAAGKLTDYMQRLGADTL